MIRSSLAALPLLLAVQLACQAPVDPAGVTGTRMFCGGGKLPPEIQQRFVELAGGEEACIVVVPTAEILRTTSAVFEAEYQQNVARVLQVRR